MTWAYYNDNEPYVCEWLRNLIKADHLPDGEVDGRPIEEVAPDDLKGFTECHFFAGIGGWPLVLRTAMWPDDRPVWTGSCPCQPFSTAGKQGGADDERHLWPVWLRLVRECRPDTIFGEQVEGAVGMGWLDRVFADLEAEDYACGAAVLGAHSVGAPHIRQRLWWVADSQRKQEHQEQQEPATAERGGRAEFSGRRNTSSGLADSNSEQRGSTPGQPHTGNDGWDNAGRGGENGGMAESAGQYGRPGERPAGQAGLEHWQSIWHPCADGKARRIPIEPSLFPLADGLSGRVGKLRAVGNAIVPQVATEFVRAYMEATNPYDWRKDAHDSYLAWCKYKAEQDQ